MMKPETKLRHASVKLAAAKEQRDAAIHEARAAGFSLRQLATMSSLGVQTVARILERSEA